MTYLSPGRESHLAGHAGARQLDAPASPFCDRALCLALALSLLLPVSLEAASGIVPDAFATIQIALDQAHPGDTVLVRGSGGPYFERVVFPRSGSATAGPITLEAFPGDRPVLDGTGTPGENMVTIESRSYIRIAGFEIRNNFGLTDGSGIRVTGSGTRLEILDNQIHDMRGENAMGITVYGTSPSASISDLTITGNEIRDCEPAPSEALTLNGNVERFTVADNLVQDVNNIGIDFIGGETDINPDPTKVARDGICVGNRVIRANSSYGGGFSAGIYVDGARDIVIERNRISGCDLGIEVGAENAGSDASGITVRNNWIWANEKACLVFGGYQASVGRTRDSDFLNNTCYRNDTLATGLGELWIQLAENNRVYNNIFVATSQKVLLTSDGTSSGNTLNHNLWHAPGGAATAIFTWEGSWYQGFGQYQDASGQDAESTFTAPQFLSPDHGDLHLLSESPGVEAGDPDFTPAEGETDIDGAPRMVGSRVEVGADELCSPAPDLRIEARMVDSAETFETCGVLRAVDGLTILGGGWVSLQAGQMIVLGNGLVVLDAGILSARVEPWSAAVSATHSTPY